MENHYSARRLRKNAPTYGQPDQIVWRGWMQYNGEGNIIATPDTYPTRREALDAIKEQHPQGS